MFPLTASSVRDVFLGWLGARRPGPRFSLSRVRYKKKLAARARRRRVRRQHRLARRAGRPV